MVLPIARRCAAPVTVRRHEEAFALQIKAAGLPAPEREWRFHPSRKWRFDFAFPEQRVAVEIDGGLFIQGGHTRGAQALKDMEKRNDALVMGWAVLRVGPQHVKSGEALAWLTKLLDAAQRRAS